MTKHCSVVCDTPRGLVTCELSLPEAATLADALTAARQVLGTQMPDPAAAGIYGELCAADRVVAEGDRIELYRPLPADPRAARRARLARAAGRVRKARGT
jgi:putative ubiquitin-RnfH superfamily antitoxin RatB of RatAB toxin-antitoxin module